MELFGTIWDLNQHTLDYLGWVSSIKLKASVDVQASSEMRAGHRVPSILFSLLGMMKSHCGSECCLQLRYQRCILIRERRKGLMRAWVFWIALKHERPRVAAGRARGPKCVRAYPRPPAFPPSGCRALPLVAGGGGVAQKNGAALARGSPQTYNLGKLLANRTFERISQKYDRAIVLSNGGGARSKVRPGAAVPGPRKRRARASPRGRAGKPR